MAQPNLLPPFPIIGAVPWTTRSSRVATKKAYEHLKLEAPSHSTSGSGATRGQPAEEMAPGDMPVAQAQVYGRADGHRDRAGHAGAGYFQARGAEITEYEGVVQHDGYPILL